MSVTRVGRCIPFLGHRQPQRGGFFDHKRAADAAHQGGSRFTEFSDRGDSIEEDAVRRDMEDLRSNDFNQSLAGCLSRYNWRDAESFRYFTYLGRGVFKAVETHRHHGGNLIRGAEIKIRVAEYKRRSRLIPPPIPRRQPPRARDELDSVIL